MKIRSMQKFGVLLVLGVILASCEEIITPDPIISDNNIWHVPEAGTRYVYAGIKHDTLLYGGETFVEHDQVSASATVVDPDTSAFGNAGLMLIASPNGTNYVGLNARGDFIRNNNVPGDDAWYVLPIGSKSAIEGPNVDTIYGNTYYTYNRLAEYVGNDTVIIHGKTFDAIHVKETSSTDQAGPGFSSILNTEIHYWYLPELRYFGKIETWRRNEQANFTWTEHFVERLVLFTK